MQERLTELFRQITPVDVSLLAQAQAHLDNLTKPKGSLGQLETVAARLFCIQKGERPLSVDPARMYTVAGDHGVAEENVSPFPQAVTRQMVQNFIDGGAAINILSRASGMNLLVVDAGCAGGPFEPHPQLRDARCGEGTANFTKGPAMNRETCITALLNGSELATQAAVAGCHVIGAGEMGIANTTSATALFSALLHLAPETIVGPGAGASAEMMQHKVQVIHRAFAANKAALDSKDPLAILAALGGFEIAVMAGLMLGGARHGLAILVDGFISTAAFVAARALCPAVEDYCFLCHSSAEPGYGPITEALGGQQPLLDLNMRLGEGTGAALALPLVRAAADIFNYMATFDEAGVIGTPCKP